MTFKISMYLNKKTEKFIINLMDPRQKLVVVPNLSNSFFLCLRILLLSLGFPSK